MATKEDGVRVREVHELRCKSLEDIVRSIAGACAYENWGLLVEAAEDYQSASYKLKHAVLPEVTWFSSSEKALFSRISKALYQKYIKLASAEVDISIIDGKQIHAALDSFKKGRLSLSSMEFMLSDMLPTMPIGDRGNTSAYVIAATKSERRNAQAYLDLPEDEYHAAVEMAMRTKAGSLLERRDALPGYNFLDIIIEKIGLKDPQNYIDPLITVSVKSLEAEDIEQCQDTPVMKETDAVAVLFNITVQIQHPLEEIPGGTAIFFEFKHFKPKKGLYSTRCFSFMEMDEIKPGMTYLEIYKKPTDFRRKKLSLLSVKPLYLHLNLRLNKP